MVGRVPRKDFNFILLITSAFAVHRLPRVLRNHSTGLRTLQAFNFAGNPEAQGQAGRREHTEPATPIIMVLICMNMIFMCIFTVEAIIKRLVLQLITTNVSMGNMV